MRLRPALCAAAAVASLAAAAPSVAQAKRFRVDPFVFDPDDTGAVTAAWRPFSGPGNSDPALLLDKLTATATNAASGADVDGVRGIILDELGFDVYRGGHCGAGAPRFNVTTTNGHTYLFFFGCAHPRPDPSPDKPARFLRIRFTDADAFPQLPGQPIWPGFGNARIAAISIVFDEGTDVGSGFTALDDIDINGELIGRGN